MEDYEDLLPLPHPSAPHPMTRTQRAAQFAPFAAMVGLEASLEEAARQTEVQVPLSEEECAELNRALRRLQERLNERPSVRLLCFEDDATKDGGRYVTVSGRVRAVDETAAVLVFEDGRRLPLGAVCALEFA